MHIEETLKLDFKDVLIRPKRSTLSSRAQVELQREFVFHHSRKTYRGIPIIAANMDSTGTLDMAAALAHLCHIFAHFPCQSSANPHECSVLTEKPFVVP